MNSPDRFWIAALELATHYFSLNNNRLHSIKIEFEKSTQNLIF